MRLVTESEIVIAGTADDAAALLEVLRDCDFVADTTKLTLLALPDVSEPRRLHAALGFHRDQTLLVPIVRRVANPPHPSRFAPTPPDRSLCQPRPAGPSSFLGWLGGVWGWVLRKQRNKGTKGGGFFILVSLFLCFFGLGCTIHNHFFENVRMPATEPRRFSGETGVVSPSPATSRPSTQPAGALDRILGAAADEAERVLHGE